MPNSPEASVTATRAVVDWASRQPRPLPPEAASLAAAAANAAVAELLTGHPELGATTLAFALLADGAAVIGAVGDSEILAIDATGPARRLNDLDHVPSRPNILLAWLDGVAPFEPHTATLDGRLPTLCLVTDGVTKVLAYDEIAAIVRDAASTDQAVEIIREAQRRRATDDVTALIVLPPSR